MHLVKLLNTETAKIKDWVTNFYGLNIFMVSFCDNSSNQATNFYLKSIWWNASKLLIIPAMLFPFLGAGGKWGGGRFGGFMGVFFDGEEHGFIGTNLEDGHLAELSAFTFLVSFLKIRVWVKKYSMGLVTVTFNRAANWPLWMDCSARLLPVAWCYNLVCINPQ